MMKTIIPLLLLAATLSCVEAATLLLASGTFDERDDNAGGGSLGVVETLSFSLTTAQIQNVSFTSNYTSIDAGIRITVNGNVLFDTGDDVSQFRTPSAFTPTINDPFSVTVQVS